MVRNGMISVPNISIEYKGFTIRPKLDMGSTPWLVNGNEYRRGYIVTRNGIQIMPGGAWFTSVIEARFAIDILIEAREMARHFGIFGMNTAVGMNTNQYKKQKKPAGE